MPELTFGEQVKIVLSRKDMTIKELAELIEERTGKKMSRQNLTQRLSRDNFQEQDMRMIAGILECPLHLSILDENISVRPKHSKTTEEKIKPEENTGMEEKDITVSEILDRPEYTVEELLAEVEALEEETKEKEVRQAEDEKEKEKEREREEKPRGWKAYLNRYRKHEAEEAVEEQEADIPEAGIPEAGMQEEPFQEEVFEEEEDMELGDINPYTGREYKTNSVRMHPDRIGYVQVYDREEHSWTDMTEWAFLGYQERKKALLGKDYEPPIYLD